MATEVTNADEVIVQLSKFTDKEVKRLILEVTATLIEDTPVDTGWAQANWIPNIGSPKTEVRGSKEAIDKSAQSNAVATIATKYQLPNLVYISNNVDYITKLNEGTSTQAPSGYVQIAIGKAIKEVT